MSRLDLREFGTFRVGRAVSFGHWPLSPPFRCCLRRIKAQRQKNGKRRVRVPLRTPWPSVALPPSPCLKLRRSERTGSVHFPRAIRSRNAIDASSLKRQDQNRPVGGIREKSSISTTRNRFDKIGMTTRARHRNPAANRAPAAERAGPAAPPASATQRPNPQQCSR